VLRRALVEEARVRLGRQPLPKGLDEAGLADARLAREQDASPLPVTSQPPPIQQQCHLAPAADERGEAGGTAGLEPARGSLAGAGHPPGAHGLRETAQGRPAEVDEVEHASEQAPGAVGDDDRAGFRELLQARRQVRGLADHCLLARCPSTEEIADNREAGGDPHPRRERVAR
jgi:hypothetical protein